MLQKILVVIVGLVMSVISALSPAGLFASNEGAAPTSLSANTAEEILATVSTTDGRAFARVSVLWVEVDGRRVTEDAWGTGHVEEIKFKVGVKDVANVALGVGDKTVPVHPTDIITVRMFRGDFSYRGMGTALATVQLQGTVKTTVLNEGDVTNRLLTRTNDFDLDGKKPAARPGDESKVAYVVLTTGEKVDTVAVETGGARLFTQEALTAAEAKDEPGNLLAKWVKIDNRIVREYTWGDGVLRKLEFEPAQAVSRSVVLTFNGEVSEVASGERVVIEDFVGEYLIYQVSGGMMRVRLDGFAATFTTGSALPLPSIGGAGAPIANFDFTPVSPKTTDTVRFTDLSEDDGGIIVFRQWDFGDDSLNSVGLERPTHRFARPGSYEVDLTVTDNDLKTSSLTRTIVVRNAEPVPDFDYSPKVVSTKSSVAFSDQSFDPDGTVVNWSWDFGDGTVSYFRHPAHRFESGGNRTVTLTTTDDLGARASISKVVSVRNSPPLAGFTFSPAAPLTADPVQFVDNSTDLDGVIDSWNWSFGDGTFGSGSAPVHAFTRPGVYTVSLRVTDDGGDSDTVSTNIIVGNRPPFPDFTWTPNGQPANVPIAFTSTSTDPDGTILVHIWDFGDGARAARGTTATHTFPRAGTYNVTLTVTDNTLGSSNITRSVEVGNSAPRANFGIQPNPAFRGTEITFIDSSTDPDGDPIVNWTWEFGDGSIDHSRVARHVYTTVGTKTVNLTVRDSEGTSATVSRPLRLLNRPPSVTADFSPRVPVAGENVTFTASGVDPDLPSGTVTFHWGFSDGVTLEGPLVTRNFSRAGNYSVVLHGRDSEGGVSPPIIFGIPVQHARPKVDFSFDPAIPLKDQEVQFFDLTQLAQDAPIREWRWHFGVDPLSTSNDQNPKFAYTRNGTFNVTLQVTDVFNQTNITTKQILINLAPLARFVAPTDPIRLSTPLEFTDTSVDDDGFIVNWTWEFGDGTRSFVRHPSHPGYPMPGAYAVNLTVRDDRNATSTATKTLNVANNAPRAAWNFSANPEERLAPYSFYGGALSSDPDGQPLVGFSWDFGDGTPLVAGANVTHTFATSGFKTVGLVVNDGLLSSPRTADSHQRIRVGASHPVKLQLTATLPGERVADITSPAYGLSVRLSSGVEIPAAAVEVNGTGLDVTIDKSLWLNGMTVRAVLTASFITGGNDQTVTLRDGVPNVSIHFPLTMALQPTIIPEPGVEAPLLPIFPQNETQFAGNPLYRDMSEHPRGTGRVLFSDGSPAGLAGVTIQARWVPLLAVRTIRDTPTPVDAATNPLIGWCNVANVQADTFGDFAWQFDGSSPCVTNGINGGLYPVGRWEVRAFATLARADAAFSPTRAFYVDPTGGALLSAISTVA